MHKCVAKQIKLLWVLVLYFCSQNISSFVQFSNFQNIDTALTTIQHYSITCINKAENKQKKEISYL